MMKRNYIIIGILALITLFASFIFLEKQWSLQDSTSSSKKNDNLTNKNLNQNSYYDPVENNKDLAKLDYSGLNQTQTFTPSTLIFQTFKSGQAVKIELPLLPVARPKIIAQGEVYGLSIKNEDYDMRLFHLLGLDDSGLYCEEFTSDKSILRFFPSASNIVNIEIPNSQSKKYELISSTGKHAIGIRSCHKDSLEKAWIVEIFSPKDLYQEKYTKKIVPILSSFEFTQK